MVDRKAGDLRPRLSADQFAKPHLSIALLLLLHILGERMPVGVLPLIGDHAQYRADPAHHLRDHRGRVPASRRETIGILGSLRLVQHGDHHIARIVLSRTEEHTSELQALIRNSYDVLSLKQKNMTHE